MIEVSVHYGDVDRALPVLKKIIQKEGRGLKMKRKHHEKKSEKTAKKKAEARKKRYQQECRRQRCGW
ncbi:MULTISPECIES: 30S ribosomal protein S21 [Wolbachia]|uniref:30S ribosomal protein S21 n=1 Tax=Wolbachia TaxID=953 RepID=UPI00024041CB|nr:MULTISPECIES: 30S ribosomal protein S21 [Wolbachia]UYC23072.1 30S ribosomal protein S21 [Wolbachia endosymbiont of Aedes aegypti]QBB83376.1 30S ribosomal protein S21 [Wolbachia pipientis wAlbB]QDW08184.1 30S ribosomal protein S21 [Wolbachia pipientis]QDW09372.1 30S ribosomal protein S21 [Wolbachia pipientis]QZA83577.1 30S ribosomal protein S21 [Wolbachia pipientis]